MRTEGGATTRTWTFLTNHARVLIAVARDPQARVRDLSALVGITERATQGILADLEKAGFVTRTRVGRRNEYSVHPDLEFRHPREAGHDVGELLALFVEPDPEAGGPGAEAGGPGGEAGVSGGTAEPRGAAGKNRAPDATS